MTKKEFRILVVDDEKSFLLLLTKILENEGYEVKGAGDPKTALKVVENFMPYLVITDMKMPEMDGLALMDAITGRGIDTEFIMITAFATVEGAVDVIKKGAVDYITKPLKNPEQLRSVVAKVYERHRILSGCSEDERLKGLPPIGIIFAGMENVLKEVRHVAPTGASVMLYGETGTGKSLIAKVIHSLSGRKGAFVDINCAAIPENLLESELFGYEKGAFTGAVASKKGRFEMADEGTIFLDEISEMSLMLQAKLLKVLQEKTFERLGSVATLKSNARVIAATNRNLAELVSAKRFREDLYYRLNVFPVSIPPLRDRKEHISSIAAFIMQSVAKRFGKDVRGFGPESLGRLVAYQWPGNIRELENHIERAVILAKGQELSLPELSGTEQEESADTDLKSVEKVAIEKALIKTDGNRKKAAELLGISLRALQYKIKDYGISR
ncbi:MAG: sigma-54-dependent Fis family transcriptional regulator [Nitrospirae bacterium]|nr:MAG: sigma-54-dependent Fis family transcriptional regulator [Nitrospirota bacterium]